MNKSKFLKKSVAALLAVMLVVAMVPLSAAASADALPALTRIYVNDTEITANGTEFSANFAEDQAEGSINVRATLPTGTKLEAFESKDSLTGTAIAASDVALTVKDYTGGNTEGVVYLKLSDTTSAGRPSVWYTLNLKQVNLDDASGVKGVSITSDGKNNGLLNATVDQENLTINVEAAYGHGAAGTITVIPTDGATVSNPVAVAADGAQFTVTAGGINTVWTIKVTEVEALLDFTVAGKQGVIDHDKKTITVNLTLDDIKDQYGDVEEDAVRAVEFSTITNTQIGWEATGASSLTTEIASGDKKALNDIQDNMKYEGVIWVKNGTGSTGVGYALTVQIPKNTDTTISYAAIGGVEATIDGTNISAVLDSTTPNNAQTLRLHVPKGATITPPTTNNNNWDTVDTSNSDYDVWTTHASDDGTAKTADTPGTKKTFVVTAADSSYSTQYSIWWTKADGQTEAALKSLNLKDGDNVYTGVVDEAKHTVTIEVPFMTTTLVPWKIFATYSAGAIGEYNGSPILSGITPVVAGVDLPANITDGTTQTIADFITVKSQGTVDVETNYALVVKFKAPNNNKKLTGMKTTVQTIANVTNAQEIARGMNDTNTYDASVTHPVFNSDGSIKTPGKVTIKTAFSHTKVAALGMYISELTTDGGIAYLYTASDGTNPGAVDEFAKIDGKKTTLETALTDLYEPDFGGYNVENKVSIVVVPEEVAKRSTPNELAQVDNKYCGFYEVEFDPADANTQGKLESLTIAGQTMRVVPGSNGTGVIMGTLPYSATVDATAAAVGANNEKNSQFLEFTLSDYAILGKTVSSATKPTDEVFTNKGDTNNDGEAEAMANGNAKLMFVRDNDHNVKVYLVKDTTNITPATTDNSISVYSESLTGTVDPTNTYTFQLKYADANNQAAITEFDLNGYKGTISGTTINVSVPKATNLKALRASYKASTGATVALDNAFNDKISSGKTVLNCSSDVKIYVRSEDESKTEVYTLKVTEGEMFVDVTKDDWFYEEVNTAANNGWINGTGEGYFTPYGSMTRGQFALIIARMEVKGFDEETEVDCPFPDVEGTAYRAAAKYVYDQGYMQGDGDNFFNANDNITRAQAAIVLCKMKGIEPMTGDTDYDDDASIADWAKGYVKAATAAGIFKGEGDDFNPQRYLRRCEGAAILVRSANK
ncbi:S-layer homology domain-containing protein [bacterium D16-76]|nr:S-layer homology domain-containing protein [bacterium D16-76]